MIYRISSSKYIQEGCKIIIQNVRNFSIHIIQVVDIDYRYSIIFTVIFWRSWSWNELMIFLVISRVKNKLFIPPCDAERWVMRKSGVWSLLWYKNNITYFFGPSTPFVVRPCTRNNEPRSAFNNMDTFCSILWHNDLTSNSLQISLTY